MLDLATSIQMCAITEELTLSSQPTSPAHFSFPGEVLATGKLQGKCKTGRRKCLLSSCFLLAYTSSKLYLKDCQFLTPTKQFLLSSSLDDTAPSLLLPAVATSTILSGPYYHQPSTDQLLRQQLYSWLTIALESGFEDFGITTKLQTFACSAKCSATELAAQS